MKVYIAGPYSARAPEVVVDNVGAAMQAWEDLRAAGFTPFCPHWTHEQVRFYSDRRHYEDWLAWDLEWLECCDAVLRLPGASPGADREVARADELGLPVFDYIDDLIEHREEVMRQQDAQQATVF